MQLIRGGQGHTDEEIEESAWIAVCCVAAVLVLCVGAVVLTWLL